MVERFVEVHSSGVGVPVEAVTGGPSVQWKHIDGPLLHWAGHIHWLTWRERLAIWLHQSTVDQVACRRWPHLGRLRAVLTRNDDGGQHDH